MCLYRLVTEHGVHTKKDLKKAAIKEHLPFHDLILSLLFHVPLLLVGIQMARIDVHNYLWAIPVLLGYLGLYCSFTIRTFNKNSWYLYAALIITYGLAIFIFGMWYALNENIGITAALPFLFYLIIYPIYEAHTDMKEIYFKVVDILELPDIEFESEIMQIMNRSETPVYMDAAPDSYEPVTQIPDYDHPITNGHPQLQVEQSNTDTLTLNAHMQKETLEPWRKQITPDGQTFLKCPACQTFGFFSVTYEDNKMNFICPNCQTVLQIDD